jgi:hypothetical protein
LAPRIDVEKSFLNGKIEFYNSPGPKKNRRENFISRTMIGDEPLFYEAEDIIKRNIIL